MATGNVPMWSLGENSMPTSTNRKARPESAKPLVQPQSKGGNKRLTVNLSCTAHAELEAYAEFLDGSEISYVVDVALRHVFEKDRAFQKWMGEGKRKTAIAERAEKIRLEESAKTQKAQRPATESSPVTA